MFQNMKKRLKNQRGLTLVELLAVIVILGIISAIAVPSISGLIDKTKEDAQVAEAIQIINAAKLYITTNPNAKTISKPEIEQYLDNVKADDFSVSYDKTQADGSKYTLKNHPAAKIVKKKDNAKTVTEGELLNYTGAN